MVSIIVPVYKVEKYLRKCVESILSQTYRDIEVILVDDGSPDSCGKICDEFALTDGRVKVIHQKNGGSAAARNAGLGYIMQDRCVNRNDYVAFVDSDDTIDSKMFYTLVNMMESGTYDLAICGHQIVHENEQPKPASVGIQKVLNDGEMWDEVFGHLNNAVWNKLYKASLLKEIRFPVGMIHGEDLIFNIEYISKCQNAIMNDGQFYHYYKRSGSITTGKFSDAKLMEITSKDEAKRLIEQYCPAQLENAELYCFRARMNVIRSVYKAGKEKEYSEQISECNVYLCKNYDAVKSKVRFKECLEYRLWKRSREVYRLIVKAFW